MQTATIYKPVILALVIEGIRNGELTDNHFDFDWLLPKFVQRLKEHGHDGADEQQLAEGFARMANDLFWLHAYRDPLELVPLDRPTPKLIRDRISHARLQEPYWQALQHSEYQQQVLDALAERWWPNVNPPPPNPDFNQSMEQLIAPNQWFWLKVDHRSHRPIDSCTIDQTRPNRSPSTRLKAQMDLVEDLDSVAELDLVEDLDLA